MELDPPLIHCLLKTNKWFNSDLTSATIIGKLMFGEIVGRFYLTFIFQEAIRVIQVTILQVL